jgi:hypothetical protein
MDREQMASALSEALRRKIVFENVSIGEYPKSLEAIVLPGVQLTSETFLPHRNRV